MSQNGLQSTLKQEPYELKIFGCQMLEVIGNAAWEPESLNVLVEKMCMLNKRILINPIFSNAFRCYVTHRIPVSYPLSHFGNPHKSEQAKNYVGGTFSQLFEVKAFPGSILITKSPKVEVEGLVGGCVSLECEAEIAPEVTSSSVNDTNGILQYQWLELVILRLYSKINNSFS